MNQPLQRSNSKIILNSHLSENFKLGRGCCQGDPISPYLFVHCLEFLTLAFKRDINIIGINIRSNQRNRQKILLRK